MRVNIDTNACLRFLLDDIPEQAAQTEQKIDAGDAYLTPEVLAECAFVLEKVYELPRSEIANGLSTLIDVMICDSKDVYRRAINIFEEDEKLDIVDSILIARKVVCGDDLLTFDKDMLKALKRML